MSKKEGIPLHLLPDVQFVASDKPIVFGGHRLSHRINFFALIWFMETKGLHYIDFDSHPIKKNSVYLLSKNQVHSIPAAQLPKAKVIVFSADFFHHIEEPQLRQLFLPFENDGIQIPDKMVKPLEQLFALLTMESNEKADTHLLLKYTTALLMHLHRFGKHRLPSTAGADARMVKLFQIMEENYKEKRSAAFYAEHIGLSPKRINEILREKAGITLSQLLYQLLLIESKRELVHGDYSIKEIAYNLGFADQSYFARFFKKHTTLTPEQFREKAKVRFRISPAS